MMRRHSVYSKGAYTPSVSSLLAPYQTRPAPIAYSVMLSCPRDLALCATEENARGYHRGFSCIARDVLD